MSICCVNTGHVCHRHFGFKTYQYVIVILGLSPKDYVLYIFIYLYIFSYCVKKNFY